VTVAEPDKEAEINVEMTPWVPERVVRVAGSVRSGTPSPKGTLPWNKFPITTDGVPTSFNSFSVYILEVIKAQYHLLTLASPCLALDCIVPGSNI